jgi:hypothetical protein
LKPLFQKHYHTDRSNNCREFPLWGSTIIWRRVEKRGHIQIGKIDATFLPNPRISGLLRICAGREVDMPARKALIAVSCSSPETGET